MLNESDHHIKLCVLISSYKIFPEHETDIKVYFCSETVRLFRNTI